MTSRKLKEDRNTEQEIYKRRSSTRQSEFQNFRDNFRSIALSANSREDLSGGQASVVGLLLIGNHPSTNQQRPNQQIETALEHN
jgi:hypothetical protein